jgi:cation transport ATPase
MGMFPATAHTMGAHMAAHRGVCDGTLHRGRGAQATVAGRAFQVGGTRLLEQEQLTLPESLADKTRTWGKRGQTVVYLVADQQAMAVDRSVRKPARAVSKMPEPGEKVGSNHC